MYSSLLFTDDPAALGSLQDLVSAPCNCVPLFARLGGLCGDLTVVLFSVAPGAEYLPAVHVGFSVGGA